MIPVFSAFLTDGAVVGFAVGFAGVTVVPPFSAAFTVTVKTSGVFNLEEEIVI